MGGEQGPIGIAEARSALTWWLEAGVDVAIQERPRDWLQPVPAPSPRAGQKAPSPERAPEPPPVIDTLDQFRDWLATSAVLPMARAGARRVLPHGDAQAAIMLLVDAPEDASAPMSGDGWQLAERMLAAIRIPPEHAYTASLSCFHAPGARLTPAEREECAEIARQHVRLVQPRRLLLLGGGPAQALLGKPLPQARGHVHKVEGVRTVVTFHPRDLIKQPSNKSLAWRDLLLLMEDES